MEFAPTALERAFQLARSGDCAGLGDIRAALKAEGYAGVEGMLAGLGLRRQLKQICDSARASAARESRPTERGEGG
jgi:hypothetical protein